MEKRKSGTERKSTMKVLMILLLTHVVCSSPVSGDNSVESCESAGFLRESLSCSTCVRLETSLQDWKESDTVSGLLSKCSECCESDEHTLREMYTSADLVVDTNHLARFPKVERFLRDKAGAFASVLKVKARWGKRPELILRDDSGKKVTSIDVEDWESEQLDEFLKRKMSM